MLTLVRPATLEPARVIEGDAPVAPALMRLSDEELTRFLARAERPRRKGLLARLVERLTNEESRPLSRKIARLLAALRPVLALRLLADSEAPEDLLLRVDILRHVGWTRCAEMEGRSLHGVRSPAPGEERARIAAPHGHPAASARTLLIGAERISPLPPPEYGRGRPYALDAEEACTVTLRLDALARAWGWPFTAILAPRAGDRPLAEFVARLMNTPLEEPGASRGWVLSVEGLGDGATVPAAVRALRERGVTVVRLGFLICCPGDWPALPELVGKLGVESGELFYPCANELEEPVDHSHLLRRLIAEAVEARPRAPEPARDPVEELTVTLEMSPVEDEPAPWIEALSSRTDLAPELLKWRDWRWPEPRSKFPRSIPWSDLDALIARGRAGDMRLVTELVTSGARLPEAALRELARRFVDGELASYFTWDTELASFVRESGLDEIVRLLEERLQAGAPLPEPWWLLRFPLIAAAFLERLEANPARAACRHARLLAAGLALRAAENPVADPALFLDSCGLDEHAAVAVAGSAASTIDRIATPGGRDALLARAVWYRVQHAWSTDVHDTEVLRSAVDLREGVDADALVRHLQGRVEDGGWVREELRVLARQGSPRHAASVEDLIVTRRLSSDVRHCAFETLVALDPKGLPACLTRALDRGDRSFVAELLEAVRAGAVDREVGRELIAIARGLDSEIAGPLRWTHGEPADLDDEPLPTDSIFGGLLWVAFCERRPDAMGEIDAPAEVLSTHLAAAQLFFHEQWGATPCPLSIAAEPAWRQRYADALIERMSDGQLPGLLASVASHPGRATALAAVAARSTASRSLASVCIDTPGLPWSSLAPLLVPGRDELLEEVEARVRAAGERTKLPWECVAACVRTVHQARLLDRSALEALADRLGGWRRRCMHAALDQLPVGDEPGEAVECGRVARAPSSAATVSFGDV